MCGIAGVFDIHGNRTIDESVLHKMNQVQSHRGPDESGTHTEPGVGLAHRRLSIIDLSSGQQPLYNEDSSVVVVYNGEIYNFQSLAEELKKLGHVFRTHCDTEVIVHAWEQWGEECVNKFRGMFAFTIWDRNKKTLFLARDRLGIKPLFYTFLPDGIFLFASELKSILQYPSIKKNIEPCSIEEYFTYGYVPEPRTIFKGILKLSPGHFLKIRQGEIPGMPIEYWDVPFQTVDTLSVEEAEEELISRLREAVNIRMIAEVPLGAFLSGGVDSSAVVAMMSELSKDPVNTCSISFGDPKFNETSYANMVAEKFNTRHRVDQVDQDDFGLIDELARLYDEPYADSSAIPTYRVCELARKQVTVALSGDGGDENFAGYRRYRWHRYEERTRSMLPYGIRRPLFGLLGTVYPKMNWAPRMFRAKTTFESLARDTIEGYLHSVSLMNDGMRKSLFSDKLYRELQGYKSIEVMRRHAIRSPTQDPLSLVQYLDMKTYLVGDILTKVDRASMAHSLEVRVPILDHKLVEWISGLPTEFKLKGSEGKYLLKKSMERYLPHDIIYRKKMGFAVPLASWFRGPLRERVREAILGPVLQDTGFFNKTYCEKIINQHQSGSRDHSPALWSLLMFEAFLRQQNT